MEVPCGYCGKPISESDTYGWLHIGGWRACHGWPSMVASPTAPKSRADKIAARVPDDIEEYL